MNIIITGGHSGMGFELSRKNLEKGHQVGLIVRSESRKKEAQQLFSGKNLPLFFVADLSKRDEIEAVVQEIRKIWPKVDGLFNNAGVLLDNLYFSEYGNELQLEINAISPYLLAKALKPLLDNSHNPFIVNTATSGLNTKKSINIPEFKKPKKFTKLFGSYIDSKLTMVLLMNHLSKEWENVRILNVDPGAIKTKMTAGGGMPFWLKPIRNIFFRSPEEGAQQLYNAAFGGDFINSGAYISKGKTKKVKLEIKASEIDQLLS
ncbi:MAG: SDR family NAD(P)-dependent oxidoreductase [Bacteroidota bacterium]